jgi:hypothetical protein
MYSLTAVLEGLHIGSSVTLGEITVRRNHAYWYVQTPHGNRRVTAFDDVLIMAAGQWPCAKCGRAKQPGDFPINATGSGTPYRRNECKDCIAFVQSVRYQKRKRDPEYRRGRALYARQWRAANPEKARAHGRNANLRKKVRGFIRVWTPSHARRPA